MLLHVDPRDAVLHAHSAVGLRPRGGRLSFVIN